MSIQQSSDVVRDRQCTRVRLEYLFWGLGLKPSGLGLEPQDSEVFRNWTQQHCMTWN